jgi:hypothetical protein
MKTPITWWQRLLHLRQMESQQQQAASGLEDSTSSTLEPESKPGCEVNPATKADQGCNQHNHNQQSASGADPAAVHTLRRQCILMRQRKLWRARAKDRSFKAIALVTILAVAGSAISSYLILRKVILKNVRQEAMYKVQQTGAELDTWLARLQAQVESAANYPQVRSLNWQKAEPFLQLEQQRSPDFYLITLVKSDGSFFNTMTGAYHGEHLRDRQFFQKTMTGNLYVSNLEVSSITGNRQINIAAPIWLIPPSSHKQLTPKAMAKRKASLIAMGLSSDRLQPGMPIGSLVGAVQLGYVQDLIEKINNGSNSYAFALDANGMFLAHPDRNLLERGESLLDSANPDLSAIASRMVNHQRNIELVEIDQVSEYIAYAPLENANWSIALVIPRRELEKSLTVLNLFASIFGGLLIATTVGMLRYLKLLRLSRENAAALRQANERSRFESNQRLQTQAALIERMSLAALSADIGIALTQGSDLAETSHRCAEALANHLGAEFVHLWTVNAINSPSLATNPNDANDDQSADVLLLRASAGRQIKTVGDNRAAIAGVSQQIDLHAYLAKLAIATTANHQNPDSQHSSDIDRNSGENVGAIGDPQTANRLESQPTNQSEIQSPSSKPPQSSQVQASTITSPLAEQMAQASERQAKLRLPTIL